jgi:hypothetical protein
VSQQLDPRVLRVVSLWCALELRAQHLHVRVPHHLDEPGQLRARPGVVDRTAEAIAVSGGGEAVVVWNDDYVIPLINNVALTKRMLPTLQRVAGAGNVYRHGYDAVVPEVIWESVRTGLTNLRAAVEAELGLSE